MKKTWQSSAIGVFRIDSHIVFQDEDIPGTVLWLHKAKSYVFWL